MRYHTPPHTPHTQLTTRLSRVTASTRKKTWRRGPSSRRTGASEAGTPARQTYSYPTLYRASRGAPLTHHSPVFLAVVSCLSVPVSLSFHVERCSPVGLCSSQRRRLSSRFTHPRPSRAPEVPRGLHSRIHSPHHGASRATRKVASDSPSSSTRTHTHTHTHTHRLSVGTIGVFEDGCRETQDVGDL